MRLFHRLVEAIGELASGDFAAAGFDIVYAMRPDGIAPGESWTANPLDPALPIARIWQDNGHAMGYSHKAWLLRTQWRGPDGAGLPDDLPDPDAGAWDPDPHWQRVLDLTETDQLDDALALVEAVPGHAREPLFDEVIYLRFLTKTPLQAQDIRVLARKHAATSSIAGRLLEEFEPFLNHLDAQFALDPPILGEMTGLQTGFVPLAVPPMPPPSDWAACRRHIAQFINPSSPRGRIFSASVHCRDTDSR